MQHLSQCNDYPFWEDNINLETVFIFPSFTTAGEVNTRSLKEMMNILKNDSQICSKTHIIAITHDLFNTNCFLILREDKWEVSKP